MDLFQQRRIIILIGFLGILGIFILRLLYVQLYDTSYKRLAVNTSLRKVTIYPARGLVFDRNGKLILYNKAEYDLVCTPKLVKEFDTMEFCRELNVSPEYVRNELKKAWKESPYRPYVIIKGITSEMFASFQENLFMYPGFFAQVRTVRGYPHPSLAHVMGYIGEVSPKQIEASGNYYRQGDYIGINGLEQIYEPVLRGVRGTRYMMIDVRNREVGSFSNGAFDTAAVAGNNLQSGIDIALQDYADSLMIGKAGAVVAIDPNTGEILAMVSTPGYDPNLLLGKDRGKNFMEYLQDPLKPMYNRAIMAPYPPGSTFKPLMALMDLSSGAIKPDQGWVCSGSYNVGSLRIGCEKHGPISNVESAIQYSCNSYFCNYFRRYIDDAQFGGVKQGLQHWHDVITSFGLGVRTGIDLPHESSGNIPDPAYYNKIYKGSWNSVTIVSLGIGQGEVEATPLQMANLMCCIANRGYFFAPHLIRKVDGAEDKKLMSKYRTKHMTALQDQDAYDHVIQGMENVVVAGTAASVHIKNITICGKTGTAQNPHGKSHSWFECFAPRENPRITVAVIVENAGWGAEHGAPIASLIIEKYINGKIAPERKAMEKQQFESNFIDYQRTVLTELLNAKKQKAANAAVDTTYNIRDTTPDIITH